MHRLSLPPRGSGILKSAMENIIKRLREDGYLKTPAILEAFQTVDRADFLPEAEKDHADMNIPLPIGYGQTNSQPLTVAFLLELLQPQPGERVLDVGAGSGWTAALFARLVGERGSVTAIERIPQLFRFAEENLKRYRFPQLRLLCRDATIPDPEQPIYDIIHVAAAAREVPATFRDRLALHGRMVIPIGGEEQTIVLVTKTRPSNFLEQRFPGFLFVPLVEGPIA